MSVRIPVEFDQTQETSEVATTQDICLRCITMRPKYIVEVLSSMGMLSEGERNGVSNQIMRDSQFRVSVIRKLFGKAFELANNKEISAVEHTKGKVEQPNLDINQVYMAAMILWNKLTVVNKTDNEEQIVIIECESIFSMTNPTASEAVATVLNGLDGDATRSQWNRMDQTDLSVWVSWIRTATYSWARRRSLDILKANIQGFTLSEESADGNCFFRAIARAVDGDPGGYKGYRRLAHQWWLDHYDGFDPHRYTWFPMIKSLPPFEVIAEEERDRVFATCLSIAAVCEVLETPVTVIVAWIGAEMPQLLEFRPSKSSTENDIKVALIGDNHYSLLMTIPDFQVREAMDVDVPADRRDSAKGMDIKAAEKDRGWRKNGRIMCPYNHCRNNSGRGYLESGFVTHLRRSHSDMRGVSPETIARLHVILDDLGYSLCSMPECNIICSNRNLSMDGACQECASVSDRASGKRIEESLTPAERDEWIRKIQAADNVRLPIYTDVPYSNRRLWSLCLRQVIHRLAAAASEFEQFDGLLKYHMVKAVLYKVRRQGVNHKKQNNSAMKLRMLRWLNGEEQKVWDEVSMEYSKLKKRGKTKKESRIKQKGDKVKEGMSNADAKRFELADTYVGAGQFSKAMSILTSAGIAKPTAEVIRQLERKHPKRKNDVHLPTAEEVRSLLIDEDNNDPIQRGSEMKNDGSDGGDGNDRRWAEVISKSADVAALMDTSLEISPEHIEKAVSRAKKTTAGGLSQVTPFLLRRAVESGVGTSLIRAMIMLAQRWTEGHYTKDAGFVTASARLIALFKDEQKKDVRPVAVGDSLRRTLCRAIFECVTDQIRSILNDHQLGVHKAGYEIGIHGMRFHSEKARRDGKAILLLDYSNAFNTIDRGLVLKLVKRFVPDLLNLTFWLYAMEPRLVLSDGSFIPSSAGAQQGCLLSNVLFGLTMKYIVSKIRAIPGIDAVLCYWDDCALVGSTSALAKAASVLDSLTDETGLALNWKKCSLHCSSESIVNGIKRDKLFDQHLSIHPHFNMIYLKVPIGEDAFVRRTLMKKVAGLKKGMEMISRMPQKQAAFLLLLQCSSICKITHLARTVPFPQCREFMGMVDGLIRETFESLIGCKLDDSVWMRCQLPPEYSGFALRSCLVTATSQFAMSLAKCEDGLKLFAPGMDINNHLPGSVIDELRRILGDPSLTALTILKKARMSNERKDDDPLDVTRRSLVQECEMHYKRAVFSQLKWEDRKWAQLHTGSEHQWITAAPFASLNRDLSPVDWLISDKLRLKLPVYSHSSFCPACKAGKMDRFGYHSLSCGAESSMWLRHEAIKVCLLRFLRNQGLTAITEQNVTSNGRKSVTRERPGDIQVQPHPMFNKQTLMIDVTVINPAAPTYRSISKQMDRGAASVAEKRKISKYESIFNSKNAKDYRFIPFAVETTGKIGNIGLGFINEVCAACVSESGMRAILTDEQTAELRARLIKDVKCAISFTLQRENACMIRRRTPESHIKAVDSGEFAIRDRSVMRQGNIAAGRIEAMAEKANARIFRRKFPETNHSGHGSKSFNENKGGHPRKPRKRSLNDSLKGDDRAEHPARDDDRTGIRPHVWKKRTMQNRESSGVSGKDPPLAVDPPQVITAALPTDDQIRFHIAASIPLSSDVADRSSNSGETNRIESDKIAQSQSDDQG